MTLICNGHRCAGAKVRRQVDRKRPLLRFASHNVIGPLTRRLPILVTRPPQVVIAGSNSERSSPRGILCYLDSMCRNIRPLFNFDPPVTESEVRAASLQFVRKISGFTKPSRPNEAAFQHAVDEIASIAAGLIASLETTAPPKNRETEAAKAKARSLRHFAT